MQSSVVAAWAGYTEMQWHQGSLLRNIGIREIRDAKTNYYNKLERQLSTENQNSRLFWKTSKQLLNIDNHSASIPTLSFNGEYADADDDEQKANMLNKFFSMQTVINDQNKHPPQVPLATDSILDSIHISEQDVRDVLKNLDVKKACGPNHINPHFLKEAAHILSQPLSILFNRSLSQGYFPSRWKDGYLTPIYKKDDKSLPSNYRPISLLDPIGKVMERCVHKHLYNYVSVNHLLTPFQSGFVPEILPPTNYYIHITLFVKLSTLARKCELSFATYPRRSTESGTEVSFINSRV